MKNLDSFYSQCRFIMNFLFFHNQFNKFFSYFLIFCSLKCFLILPNLIPEKVIFQRYRKRNKKGITLCPFLIPIFNVHHTPIFFKSQVKKISNLNFIIWKKKNSNLLQISIIFYTVFLLFYKSYFAFNQKGIKKQERQPCKFQAFYNSNIFLNVYKIQYLSA